ncbi:MAG: hypothetical protein IPL54_03245 [Chitinophagaceae bacterium]|nr:hypothetical protein [Chitinophagaceae bacterium]
MLRQCEVENDEAGRIGYLQIPRQPDVEIIRYLKKRLEITDEEYDKVMINGVKKIMERF